MNVLNRAGATVPVTAMDTLDTIVGNDGGGS